MAKKSPETSGAAGPCDPYRPCGSTTLAVPEAPAYYTTGNHEAHVDTERALGGISAHGVRVLRNVVVRSHGLQLTGLDYMRADDNAFDLHVVNDLAMERELPRLPVQGDLPILLTHHSPVGIPYAVPRGVSLMVTGHTHAGQVWPATRIAKLQFPFLRCLYESDGLRVFVSQGAGRRDVRDPPASRKRQSDRADSAPRIVLKPSALLLGSAFQPVDYRQPPVHGRHVSRP